MWLDEPAQRFALPLGWPAGRIQGGHFRDAVGSRDEEVGDLFGLFIA